MHLKSIGALVARTLSYEDCEFALVENDSDEKSKAVYNASAELWADLLTKLGDRVVELKQKNDMKKKIKKCRQEYVELDEVMLFQDGVMNDSDEEDEDSEDEDQGIKEQRLLRRKFRNREPGVMKCLFWSAHQVRMV